MAGICSEAGEGQPLPEVGLDGERTASPPTCGQRLLERREKVTIDVGCVRNAMDLGGLARQVQKRARQRRQAVEGGRPA